jgi:hypothetical protein
MNSKAALYPVVMIALIAFPLIIVAQDKLTIRGVTGGEDVLVMMDSRTNSGAGGCSNDGVFRSSGNTGFDNRLASAGCNSEIAVFSENHAMFLETDVIKWTDKPGDVHRITVRRLINVPVSVWIVDKAAVARAHDEMNNANLLYRQNMVGVRFVPFYKRVRDKKAVDTIGKGIEVPFPDLVNIRCTDLISVQKSGYYAAGRLNVYYVDGNFRGRNCAIKEAHPFLCDCDCAMNKPADGDGNITFVGRLGDLATLAHELGHAFGLRPAMCHGHTDTVEGFGADNLMFGGGLPTRNRFSLGQVFRMNTHEDKWGGTMLIKNGLRPGLGRKCLPNFTSDKCPTLETNWPNAVPSPASGSTPHDLLAARYEKLEEQARKDPRFKMKSTKEAFIARYQ